MNTLKNVLKTIATYALVISLIYLLLIVGFKSIKVVIAPEASAHELEIKEDEIGRIMKLLAQCESHGNLLAIHLNDGRTGVHSYGKYQWQLESAWAYNLKYKVLPDIEKNELINIIYDETFQDNLTRNVLEEGAWRNWWNCLHKYYE